MPVAVPVVTSGGEPLPADFMLLSVEVTREVGRIPHARLVLNDGDLPARSFPALDSAAFAPGSELEIGVRVDDRTTPLFKGVVARVRFELRGGAPRLTVECKDKAWRLTRPARSTVYAAKSDADAVGAILERNALDAGALEAGITHAELVQYQSSDWDFLLGRAAANGFAVVVKDGEVSMRPVSLAAAPALTLELGLDGIGDLELELDATGQQADLEAIAWDLPGGALTSPAAARMLSLAQGNTDPVSAAEALGLGPARLAHMAPLPPDELRAWASAQLARQRLSLLRGRLSTGGVAVEPLDLVELRGVGARFGGKALVSGVRHLIEGNGWRSDIQLGLAPQPAPAAAPPVAPRPLAQGLRIGIVHEFEDDPAGEQRVRVQLPDLFDTNVVWARLATPEAGSNRGFMFRPQPGDEVVVGFLANDPDYPVILGALFGSRNAPPGPVASASADNKAKGFLTASEAGIEITDQASPVLKLKTKAAALTLDDEAGAMILADGNGNEIRLEQSGITITSAGAFAIEASGEVSVKGATIALN